MIIHQRNITSLSDQEILDARVCDIRIPVREVHLVNSCFLRLREELSRRRLKIVPHIWVSDEWYVPDSVAGMAVPFYLLHPRLIKLATQQLFHVEGGDRDACMKLMRHEMGHIVDNVYLLRRRRMRQRLFGVSSMEYPESYSPKPYSPDYVRNLDSWYAQAHPDEDWAETFAVWLNPQSKWRQRYPDGLARYKLNYMNEVMNGLEDVEPSRVDRGVDIRSTQMKFTIRSFFDEHRRRFLADTHGYFDDELKRIFTMASSRTEVLLPAASFVRNNAERVIDKLSVWTGYDQAKLNSLLDYLIERCLSLRLSLRGNSEEALLDLVAMLAAKISGLLAAGKYKINL